MCEWLTGEAGDTCYYCGSDLEGCEYKITDGQKECEGCHEDSQVYDHDNDDDVESYMEERFADPGGESNLYPETKDNPRIYPCPSCDRENCLTARDVAEGYQCDQCADQAEHGY